MDYREAIKEAEAQIDMYEAFILYNNDFEPKNDNSNYEFKMDFLKTAISAMQELQMYKENQLCLIPESVYKQQCEELDEYKKLGTLEELKEITQINFNAVELSLIYNCIEQLIKYQQLGTLEEVRYAVEKQTAISREIIEGKYFCPKCHNLMPYPGYCGCGQKLY